MARVQRRRKARQGATFAASALFHVVLFFVGFSRAAGDLVSAGDAGGGPQGPVFAVSLVRLQAPTAEAEALAQAHPLLIKLRPSLATDGIPVPTAAEPDRLSALAERLGSQDRQAAAPDRRPEADRVQPQGSYIPDAVRLSDAHSRKARTDLGTDGETSNAASTGALWGAMAPCWRNLGFRGQVAVTIEVSLNARGSLSGPPRVMRATTALLSDPRLKSEANALMALTACMPKGDLELAGKSYRLEFPATP